MPRLKTGYLKLRGEFLHVLSDASDELNAAPAQLLGLLLGDVTTSSDNDARGDPSTERVMQLAIIHVSGSQLQGTQLPGYGRGRMCPITKPSLPHPTDY